MRTLRRAKRRAVRRVKVVELRTHVCEDTGCDKMSLQGEETEDESEVGEGLGGGGTVSSINLPIESIENIPVDSLTITTSSNRADAPDTNHIEVPKPDRPKLILQALRLHLEEKHLPRLASYPCPFVSLLDANTLVVQPLRHLSSDGRILLPSPPSLRKMVLLLIPPIAVPGKFRIADEIPSSVEEVVVYLWRRHAASKYDSFTGTWAAQMTQRGWGPEKIWGHWCNFVLSCSVSKSEERSGASTMEFRGRRKRTFTFVGTGGLDPHWLDARWFHRRKLIQGDQTGDVVDYRSIQRKFEEGMRECMRAKVLARRSSLGGPWERGEGEVEIEECLDSIRFLGRDEYLAQGGWEGEFTREEVMYHG